MNNNRLQKFLVVFFILCSMRAYSANNVVATADFYSLVMFHPDMCDFVPSKCAFKTIRPLDDKNKIKEIKKEIKKEVANLRSAIDEIEVERSKLETQTDDALRKLDTDYDLAKSNPNVLKGDQYNEAAKYNFKKEQINERYNNKISEYNKKIAFIEKRLIEIRKYNNIDAFTTPEETKEQFQKVILDVKKSIEEIAKRKGCSVVINSSENRVALYLRNEKNKYVNINYTLREILYPKNLQISKDYLLDEFTDNVKTWQNQETRVLGKELNDLLPKNSILIGGIDITKDVLLYIMDKNKIEKSVSAKIADIITRY